MNLAILNLSKRFSIQRDSEALRLRIIAANRAEFLRRHWFTWQEAA